MKTILKAVADGGMLVTAPHAAEEFVSFHLRALAVALLLFILSPYGRAQNINTIAGTGAQGYSKDGTLATSALLFSPAGVVVDGNGDIFIADTNNCVVREVVGGNIMTVAGVAPAVGVRPPPNCGYSGDGLTATSSLLNRPAGLALDGAGNLYIADVDNCLIRQVTLSVTPPLMNDFAGSVVTNTANQHFIQCGYAGDTQPATSSQLNAPYGIAFDGNGNLYIADSLNCLIRMVANNATQTITTYAGLVKPGLSPTPVCGYNGDGEAATAAELSSPTAIAIDSTGNLYIADTYNYRVRLVSPSALPTISTYAGNGFFGYSGDNRPAAGAELAGAWSLAVDGSGDLYISDPGNQVVREVTPGVQGSPATIVTFAGNSIRGFGGDGGPPAGAQLAVPAGIWIDGAGNLYLADRANSRIREVTGIGISGSAIPKAPLRKPARTKPVRKGSPGPQRGGK